MVDPLPACRDVALDGAATRLARWRDDFRSRVFPAGPLLPTPLGRILERAGPDAVPQRLRRELCVHVVLGVASVRDGVALPNHPGIQILGLGVAYGNDPAIAVGVARFARHEALADVVR
jgi:hypothetical protein